MAVHLAALAACLAVGPTFMAVPHQSAVGPSVCGGSTRQLDIVTCFMVVRGGRHVASLY